MHNNKSGMFLLRTMLRRLWRECYIWRSFGFFCNKTFVVYGFSARGHLVHTLLVLLIGYFELNSRFGWDLVSACKRRYYSDQQITAESSGLTRSCVARMISKQVDSGGGRLDAKQNSEERSTRGRFSVNWHTAADWYEWCQQNFSSL